MPADLLVTGCYRSGTTLLEKLLHQHPEVCVASQPYPPLWFVTKQRLLDHEGLDRRYPLEHGFLERHITPAALHAFLDRHRFAAADVASLFELLADYGEGLWTPEVLDLEPQVAPDHWLGIARQLNRLLAGRLGRPTARWVGSKEILCEEYAPYLVQHGYRVLVILRDPRAMIASLDYRRRDNATGHHRPILYSLRLWRKSVAYALAWQEHPGFGWVRYEDLVDDPARTLDALFRWLGLDPLPSTALSAGIRDQRGALWRGNSSFADHSGVSRGTATRYLELLPQAVQAYIEALCEPELRALGYPRPLGTAATPELLEGFKEPAGSLHAKFEPGYATAPARVSAELKRLALLRPDASPLLPPESRQWFIQPAAYQRLRRPLAVCSCGRPDGL